MKLSTTDSTLFFNSRTNTLLRLPEDENGHFRLDIENRSFHLPVEALELLNYHLITIDPLDSSTVGQVCEKAAGR